MALVLSVMAAFSLVASISRVDGSTSTKTGRAPVSEIDSAVAKNVCETVTTSSPAPMPSPRRAR